MTDFNKEFISYKSKRYNRKMRCVDKQEAIGMKKIFCREQIGQDFIIRKSGDDYSIFQLNETTK